MDTWLSRRKGEWFLITVCLLLCGVYYYCFVNRALVEVSIEVDKRTFFRIYWAEAGKNFSAANNSRVLVTPGKRDYRFYITNLSDIDRLRVDPHDYIGRSTIHRLLISQNGLQPLTLFNTTAEVEPIDQIADFIFDEQGLKTSSSGSDPRYLWKPEIVRTSADWPLQSVRLLTLFLLLYTTGRMTSGLFPKKTYICYYLVAAATLILVMAAISKPHIHPDEYVHIQAAGYYIDHWLPPEVESEEIRHTYSRYGVSRLNGPEIYYFFAGKFAKSLELVPIPDYLVFRLFNVLLFGAAVLISLRFSTSRMVMAGLLISPQLWYVFSYCNSDALALFVCAVAGWQVIDRQSVFNRFLQVDNNSPPLLSILFPAATIGLLFLLKKNYHPFSFFLLTMVIFSIWLNRDQIYIRAVITRFAVLCLIGVSLPIVKIGLDYTVNGIDRNEKIVAVQKEMAEPMFNPATELNKRHVYLNMKERGVTLAKMVHVHRWFEKTFRSAFGVYGHMTVSATHTFYDIMRWLALAPFIFVAGSVLFMGSWPERLVMAGAVSISAALVGASFHHSWTADFQAQGRYLLPIVLIIGVAAANAERCISRRLFCLLITLVFAVSSYSFVAVGLLNIDMIF